MREVGGEPGGGVQQKTSELKRGRENKELQPVETERQRRKKESCLERKPKLFSYKSPELQT